MEWPANDGGGADLECLWVVSAHRGLRALVWAPRAFGVGESRARRGATPRTRSQHGRYQRPVPGAPSEVCLDALQHRLAQWQHTTAS
jgi:hypothetical protein